jgi:magnesium transporter
MIPATKLPRGGSVIRSLYRAPDGALHSNLTVQDLTIVIGERTGTLWLDLASEPPQAGEPLLRNVFGFHPLAVEDALAQAHVPRVDDWGDYLYLVLHAVSVAGMEPGQEWRVEKLKPEHLEVTTLEIDVFLGAHYLVTHHKDPVPALEVLWLACQRDERHLQRGVAHLAYELADALASGYMPVVDWLDEVLDRIEDEVFTRPDGNLLARTFALKRSLVHLRRIIAPQRETLNKLARGDFAVLTRTDSVFFRDVYDHMVRLYDIVDGLRDLVGDALETYLSVVNNRMNEVVKALTVITTLFMPISFLASFFGMNFFEPVAGLHAWTSQPAFYLTLLVSVLLPVSMILWLRRRAWM